VTFDRTELQRVLENVLADPSNRGVGIYHSGIDETRIFSSHDLSFRGYGPHFSALERVGWDIAWYNQEPIFGYYIEMVAGAPGICPYSGLNNALGGGPVPRHELNELAQALGLPVGS
jgi:hypothetical protein